MDKPKSYSEQQAEVAEVLARWPESRTFRLRGHAGTFRVSARNTYHNGTEVMLYTQRLSTQPVSGHNPWGAGWLDFAKGTEAELLREVI